VDDPGVTAWERQQLLQLLRPEAAGMDDAEIKARLRAGFIRGHAISNAQRWLVSAEEQLRRGEQAGDETLRDVMLASADLELCLVSLVRFRRAAVLLVEHLGAEQVRPLLEEFDESTPDLVKLRNVGDHWDDYSRGAGRVEPTEQRGKSYEWGKGGVSIETSGRRVNLTRALDAARILYEGILKAYPPRSHRPADNMDEF
jgi:hypothetical protein